MRGRPLEKDKRNFLVSLCRQSGFPKPAYRPWPFPIPYLHVKRPRGQISWVTTDALAARDRDSQPPRQFGAGPFITFPPFTYPGHAILGNTGSVLRPGPG